MNMPNDLTPPEVDPLTFKKELRILFEIDVEGKKEQVFAGNIEEVTIDSHIYGYEATVSFSAFDNDKMNQLFADEKVMKATLTFKSTDPKKEGTPILEIKGIVCERSYHSLGKGVQKKPMRLYKVRFTDPAKITWSHHFPIRVVVDKTMKDVIAAEINPLVSIKYDWDVLTKVSPIIAFSLEFRNGLPQNKQVSFYSFLMWYLHHFNGILEYDYKESAYSLVGKKTEKGKPIPIAEWTITPAECVLPEPPRFIERLIKHSAANEEHNDKDNPKGFQAVRKEAFDGTSYPHFPEQVFLAVQSKPSPEKPSISFFVKDFSEPFNIEQLVPNGLIEIKEDAKHGGIWCDDPSIKDKTFRITDISFKAVKDSPSEGVKKVKQSFRLKIQVLAESKDDTHIKRPEFIDPVYPFSIPGKIFSEVGDKEQTTFNVVKHEKRPLWVDMRLKFHWLATIKKLSCPSSPTLSLASTISPSAKISKSCWRCIFKPPK